MSQRSNRLAFERPPSAGQFWFSVGAKTLGSFTEVSGLGVRMLTEVNREGGRTGETTLLPGELEWTNLQLKRGLTASDDLLNWLKKTSSEWEAKKTFTTYTAMLALLDDRGDLLSEWVIHDALPVAWTGPTFSTSASQVAIEEIEIAHSGIISRDRV